MANPTDDRTRLKRAVLAMQKMQGKIDALEKERSEPIAIVGMGCRFPGGANNPDELWKLLADGVDAIEEVPAERWDAKEYFSKNADEAGKISTVYGGFLKDVDKFDADFFGLSPREVTSLDPQQRLLLEVSWEALESAGITADDLKGTETGVFVGISNIDFAQILAGREETEYDSFMGSGSAHSVAAGRLSYLMGLQGPCLAIDTACSSSLSAVHLACQSLQKKECSVALAEGVNLILTPTVSIGHSRSHMLPEDGRCKTFDESADGFIRSEGCGAVVLKRLSQAIADNDQIWAVIRGSAINQDGRTSGLTVPNGPSQQRVIEQACVKAGMDPAAISYLEAHGTGTSLGDPIELGALGSVFGKSHSQENPLLVGSIKTNIGHTEAAAGIAGLIKTVLMMKNKQVPPHLHFNAPNSTVPWDEIPVKVPTELSEWKSDEHKRAAGVSSFGFGGSNAHVILEEYAAKSEELNDSELPMNILALSAQDENGLQQLAQRYVDFFETDKSISLTDVCFSANTGRKQMPYRVSFLGSSVEEIVEKLKAFINNEDSDGIYAGNDIEKLNAKKALVFDEDRKTESSTKYSNIDLILLPSDTKDVSQWKDFFASIAEAFATGVMIDWQGLYIGFSNTKVSLPTYPFQRDRYWPIKNATLTSKQVPLHSLEWSAVSADCEKDKDLAKGLWVLLGSEEGVSSQIANKLESQGARCIHVFKGEKFNKKSEKEFTINPEESGDFESLLSEIKKKEGSIAGIIHALGIDANAQADVSSEALMQKLLSDCGSSLQLVKALDKLELQSKLWLLCTEASLVGDEQKTISPNQAPLSGVGKVIGLEYGDLWGGMLDLSLKPSDNELNNLIAQVCGKDAEAHLALRGDEVYVPRVAELKDYSSNKLNFKTAGTYLVTGGCGSLGLQVAKWLSEQGASNIVLTGRSGLSDNNKATVEGIEKKGARVTVLRADAGSESDMENVFATISKELPPLKGVVHAAGVAAFDLIEDISAEMLDSVTKAKVAGAWILHRLTESIDLDFFACFSSISSVWGSKGQAHYAAANSYLDALCEYRKLQGKPALSINWGPWGDGGMATEETSEILARTGIKTISSSKNIAAFGNLLNSKLTNAVVADVEWNTLKELFSIKRANHLFDLVCEESSPKESVTAAKGKLVSELQNLKAEARQGRLIELLQEAIARILGLPDGKRPQLKQGFIEMGMDSLMVIELKDSIGKELGITTSATITFDYPNIEKLSSHLEDELGFSKELSSDKVEVVVEESRSHADESIAIVGMGCRFPGDINNPEEFREALLKGIDCVTDIPEERWDVERYYSEAADAEGKMYTRKGSFISDVDLFDAQLFGISGREAVSMDPQQRILLEVSREALENAGQLNSTGKNLSTGVFVGITSSDYQELCVEAADAGGLDTYDLTGNANNVAAGRISYALGFQGPCMSIDTACSSSLVAVHTACQSLRNNDCSMAIAGGVNLILSPDGMVVACRSKMLSVDGRCKTFDESADGYGRGEGCGVVILKRYSDARRDNDNILAVIKGSAINHCGTGSGLTVPNGQAQQDLIRKALDNAGVSATEIDYLEAHGTGTSLGDPIELKAASAVLCEGRDSERPLQIGSVKTNIGHLESAAGIAGLIKAVVSMQAKSIPPHLHLNNPNSHIDWDKANVNVPSEVLDWQTKGELRHAGVSSFGFSGTNAHVVVEEAPIVEAIEGPESRPYHIFAFSAQTEEAFDQLTEQYKAFLANTTSKLEDICHVLTTGRQHLRYRCAFVVSDLDQLRAKFSNPINPSVCDPDQIQARVSFSKDSASSDSNTFFIGDDCDWQHLCHQVSTEYLEGAEVDWNAFDEGFSFKTVLLPSYPFQRKQYWVEKKEKKQSNLATAGNSLQGKRLALAGSTNICFETYIESTKPGFIRDHQVDGNLVLPGSAYVELVLNGASDLFEKKVSIQDLSFRQMMIVEAGEGRKVQTIFSPLKDSSGYSFEIYSSLTSNIDDVEWLLHASGKVVESSTGQVAKDLNLSDLKNNLSSELSTFEHYSACAERGLAYGPSFKGLNALWRNEEATEALGHIIYSGKSYKESDYRYHPALLDCCFQVLAGLNKDASDNNLFVPSGIKSIQVFNKLEQNIYCHASLNKEAVQSDKVRSTDLVIFNTEGDVLAVIEGFEISALGSSAAVESTDDWLYTVDWKKESEVNRTLDHKVQLEPVAKQAWDLYEELAGKKDLKPYYDALEVLEERSIDYVVNALITCGVSFEAGISLSPDAIIKETAITEEHKCFLVRMLSMLEEEGILEPDSGNWKVLKKLEKKSIVADLNSNDGNSHPAEAEIGMLQCCGENLADVLQGKCEALELLFPQTGLAASALYQDSLGAVMMNDLVCESIKAIVADLPSDRKIRVLEIGAGTGGTTSAVLKHLPLDRTEYVYTDISPVLITQAQQKFSEYSCLTYHVINIENDPIALLPESHGFDIVIAANVLHATQDIKTSLKHIRRVANHNALLVLMEGTSPLRFIDLIFGMTDGWWRYTDSELRPNHPLISPEKWKDVLLEVGFEDALAIADSSENNSGELLAKQAVVVARNGTSVASVAESKHWLLIPDTGGVAAETEKNLKKVGHSVQSLSAQDLKSAESLDKAVQNAIDLSKAKVAGIVDLRYLDDAIAEDPDSETVLSRSLDSCRDVLELVQSIIRVGAEKIESLYVVTNNAMAVNGRGTLSGAIQSPIWGMLKSYELENSEAKCRCIDLDPANADKSDLGRCLFEELTGPSSERQVAYRNNERLFARLNRFSYSDEGSERAVEVNSDATYLISGGMRGLGMCAAEWLVENGARNLVLLGRREADEEVLEHVQAMEKSGARVLTMKADVCSESDMKSVFENIREKLPLLKGVIHCAGVLSDAFLFQQSSDTFKQTMGPKVEGTWILHQLTKDLDLDFFSLFSSTASVLGSPGQSNHGAANMCMDVLAAYRRTIGLPAMSVNWGAWSEVGAGARYNIEERIAAKGMGVISPKAGMDVFGKLLAGGYEQVAVVPIRWPKFAAQFKQSEEPSLLKDLIETEGSVANDETGLSGEGTVSNATKTPLEFLKEQAIEILQLREDELVLGQSLNSMGLDSLMAVELKNRIEAEYAYDISVVDLLDGASIESLQAQLDALQPSVAVKEISAIEEPEVKAEALENEYDLTAAQQALWFFYQGAPESPAYNTAFAGEIQAAVDLESLNAAFRTVVERHGVLRSRFKTVDGEVKQQVFSNVDFNLELIASVGLSDAELEDKVQQAYREPFDLENGPVIRARLFTCSPARSVLLLTFHHIISDAWSMWVILRELKELYKTYCLNSSVTLPAVKSSYNDFVSWQSDLVSSEEGTRLEAFWLNELKGAPPVIDLPLDFARPDTPRLRGDTQRLNISDKLSTRLKEFSKDKEVTLYTTLLTAFQVFLHRYSSQTDIVVGSPVACRNEGRFAQTAGYFVNQLPMRLDLEGNPNFDQLSAKNQKNVLSALKHQDYPFPLLVRKLQPVRDAAYSPVFQTYFVLQKPPQLKEVVDMVNTADKSDLPIAEFNLRQMEGQFDLMFEVTEGNESLTAALKYNTDIFTPESVARMASHLETLLEGIVEEPDAPIAQLPLMTSEEEDLVVNGWNNTACDYDHELTLVDLFEKQVMQAPNAPAISFEGETLSYDEFNARSNQLAHYLIEQGLGSERMVGISIERSIEMLIGLYGILKSGAAYVPVDPHLPEQRIQDILTDIGSPIVLTQERFVEKLKPLAGTCSCEALALDSAWGSVATQPRYNPSRVADAGNMAYMIYTSGSTGKPKGTIVTHKAIVNRLLWMQDEYSLNADDIVLQKTPFNFDVSVWEFFWPLQTGAQLLIAKPEGHKDSEYLIDLIVSGNVSTIHFVPSMLQLFLSNGRVSECVSLDRIICSGEALPVKVAADCKKQLKAGLYNLYGPTEAAVDVTAYTCDDVSSLNSVPIGRPVSNTQIYILDEQLKPVPVGMPGELHIGGVQVARGYHNNKELTDSKFIPDPFSNEADAKLYKTGDRARFLQDGNVEYLGRLDFQVKIRGFRVELGEIEILLREHDKVDDAVVIYEKSKGIIAYLVCGENQKLENSEYASYLRDQLPEYMVPAIFMHIDSIPLNSNGKIDRKALPVAEGPKLDLQVDFVKPRNDSENRIASIWKECLELDEVGVKNNFFDLGGHSLILGEVHNKLRKEFDTTIPLLEMFNYPTIESLACVISGKTAESKPEEKRADVRKKRRATVAQQRNRRRGR